MPFPAHTGDAVRSFGVSAKFIFMKALLGESPTSFMRIAGSFESETDEVDFPMLKPLAGVREWVGDRVYQTIETMGWKKKLKEFENSVEVDRDFVENDNIGMSRHIFEGLGQSFRDMPDDAGWALWKNGEVEKCFDGQPFFSTSHPVGSTTVSNFTSGAGEGWYVVSTKGLVKPVYWVDKVGRKPFLQALDKPDSDHVVNKRLYRYVGDAKGLPMFGAWHAAYKHEGTLDATNFASVLAAMRSYKKDNGSALNIVPDLLICGPANQAAAEKLLNTQLVNGGESNPHYKKVELLVVNQLG